MKNFEVVLEKTPPRSPQNHQTLCYYFENFDENNNKKKFIDAIINLGAYDLTTKISKADKSSEIKIFVKKKYDIILQGWVDDRIGYQAQENSKEGRKLSSHVPHRLKSEWIIHLFSIRNLGLEQDHLALIDNLISCSKLQYFNNFDQDMIQMTQLKFDDSMFPKKIVDYFGYDNETLFSVKLKEHNIPVQWLDDKWHYFFYDNLFIPRNTKLIHTINKRFDIVWRNINA